MNRQAMGNAGVASGFGTGEQPPIIVYRRLIERWQMDAVFSCDV